MSERKSVFLLIAIMITSCIVVAGVTIIISYRTAVREERQRLIEIAKSHSRLIESTARFNAVYSKQYPGGPNQATLRQIVDAHDHDVAVGKIEFVLSKKEGEDIVFLLRHRHDDHSKPKPVPFDSKLAEPMRRALSGQSGSIIGIDYHRQMVLAAYEPLKELGLGIVTKIDMSEVRKPFVGAGLIVIIITVLVVSIGAGFFLRVANPMVVQLEKRALELKTLNNDMKLEINERKRAEEALRKAHDELEHRVDVRTAELNKANRELKREIEERIQAEKSVRESEEKYRLLINMLPGVVYKGYKDWSIEFFDKKVQWLTGYGADEFSSQNMKWCDVILKEDIPTVREDFIRAMKADKTFVREYRIKTRSGEILWIQDRGQIVYDGKAGVEYVSGVFFDITDRKRQQEELQKSKKLLQSVFDGITDPLLLMDKNLSVSIANHAAMQYYQKKEPAEIEGKCCYEAFLGKSAPCEGCQVPATVAVMKSSSFERRSVMNPGRLEKVTIYPLDENTHRFGGALIRIHDITESRLMERKMIENERLAALGLTVSCISHEITNPISAISFNAPILKEYIDALISIVDDHAKGREDFGLFQMPYPRFRDDVFNIIANILHASSRVSTTVSDLRKLYGSKKQPKEKRWVNLKQLIERITALAGVEVGQFVKSFEINVPKNLPEIYTDPDAVEHILTNLLINAAHAADKDDSRIRLAVKQGKTWKDHLVMEVIDNGCGMAPEIVSKIFDPFFSTKPAGQGTGLGLYLCRDLVRGLGGRIEVQSEPGKGSVFRVVLPDIERRSAKRV